MNKNHESQEKSPEWYHSLSCQGAIDWYISLKTEEYCFELQDKFLMREAVDCVRNEEQQKHCTKDKTGQLVFNDIRDLLFVEEMKLIQHVFKEMGIIFKCRGFQNRASKYMNSG